MPWSETSPMDQRVQFVTVISQGTLQSPYRVPYAVFAKGEAADRLIIVGLVPGEMSTIYRMRGVLSKMTTQARTSPFMSRSTMIDVRAASSSLVK